MLQQRVVKQKALQIVLDAIDFYLPYISNREDMQEYSNETQAKIYAVIQEQVEETRNKLNKITLRPKNEISNGSSIS